jgi:hypothetical protein
MVSSKNYGRTGFAKEMDLIESPTRSNFQQLLLDFQDQFADSNGWSSPEDQTVAWILVVWFRRIFEVGEDLVYGHTVWLFVAYCGCFGGFGRRIGRVAVGWMLAHM